MPSIVWDLAIVTGAIALVVGLGMAWLPLGIAAGGGLLLTVGVWGARAAAHERRNRR